MNLQDFLNHAEKLLPQKQKTLDLLEFDRIREAAADCSQSAEAACIIRKEMPLFDPEKARERKNLVSSLCGIIANAENEPRQELPETGFLLPKLSVEGSVLDADEVLALGLFLERGEELRQFVLRGIFKDPVTLLDLHNIKKENENLRILAESVPDCSLQKTAIFRIIDKDGSIRDLPEIKKIRRRILELGKDIEHIAARFSSDESTRRMLQTDLPSQRDGRLVLAVKANFRGRIKGIVHEVSATGQTIFVEPEESVEKNNQILIEKANLEAEIRRLLRDLTAELSEHRFELEEFHQKIIYLESLRARARYSRGGCFAALPDTKEANSILILKQARHPLLGRNAVPIDLSLDSGTRMVIITGPNTGGKTVTLKTIGLFALMNQTGLALPAAQAVLPVFDGIFADIGDEQSLSQSLSTFSGHMTNIASIIGEATGQSLVLLDELGAGTDPEEGSAIAMSILDHFMETKSIVFSTTHHGMLKNYGYSRENVENASVEFDRQTLTPTYRIIMGIPGESRAVDIASRNGFPPALVEKAHSYLDKERTDVSALIAGLKEKHRELDNASRSAKKEEERLREERRHADLKALSLRQKEFIIKQEGGAEFRRFLAESRKDLENLVREIREGELSREKTVKVKEFIRNLEKRSAAISETLKAEEAALFEMAAEMDDMEYSSNADIKRNTANGGAYKRNAHIAPGTEVLAGVSRQRGVVIRRDNKKTAKKNENNNWIVEIGSVRMSFPEKELFPVLDAGNSRPAVKKSAVGWAAELDSAAPKLEINLLGMRLPEALEALRRQLDSALLSGLREFYIVHGKGDGILQKGVQDYLREDPSVAEYHFSRPEMGGSGRTEVVLKS